jgi:2-methylcitrate dehydratase PrpD
MTLRNWAELLLQTPWSPGDIDLHINDTVAAFFVGLRTGEGHALCAFYRDRADPADGAAAAAAIVRLSECDDIHPASCITPGAVVVPVVLALADGRGGENVHRALAAGYAAGLRFGLGMGGTHALAGGVWPTLAAAPLMAAVAASCMRGHDAGQLAHAMALALAGASGRPGRPIGSPSGRWFLLAEAVARGMRASEAAGQGFRGDLALLSSAWLAALAGHDAVDMEAFAPSARAPSLEEVDYKPFPIARQGANAVAAFQSLLAKGLDPDAIERIEVFVPAANVALLGRPLGEHDRLSRLAHMGFQLACAALAPERLDDSERAGAPTAPLLAFAGRVSVVPAHDLDAHLPDRWPARILVHAGRNRFEETIIHTVFDHGAPGLAPHLQDKWRRLLRPWELAEIFGGDDVRAAVPPADLWQRMERRVRMG